LEKDTQQRSKLKVWASVALGVAVLVAGAVVFAATRDPRSSYESPLTILEIMVDEAGYQCRVEPRGTIILLEDKDTILCVPPSAPNKAATIQTFADPADVDSEVRFAGDQAPPGDEGETWIVGKNWIVELPRSSASTSEQREMAEVLEGEIFMPGARARRS
jgi:hypothetical protein